jgi:hypothetical protein
LLGELILAVTKTSIVSLALMLLGHKPIITLDNPDDLTIAAEQSFDILLPSVLSTGNWRFSMQIQQLSLSPIIPPKDTNWQNVYYLPAGYLKNIRIIPNNYVYEIYSGGLIYCNWGTLTPVFMEFAFLPALSQIPMVFINYFIYEIAAFLALSNAQKADYYQVLEQKRITQLAIAAATDAQNRPQFSQVDIPVLNRRNITGIIGPQIG